MDLTDLPVSRTRRRLATNLNDVISVPTPVNAGSASWTPASMRSCPGVSSGSRVADLELDHAVRHHGLADGPGRGCWAAGTNCAAAFPDQCAVVHQGGQAVVDGREAGR